MRKCEALVFPKQKEKAPTENLEDKPDADIDSCEDKKKGKIEAIDYELKKCINCSQLYTNEQAKWMNCRQAAVLINAHGK